jgi:hypothetical protein
MNKIFFVAIFLFEFSLYSQKDTSLIESSEVYVFFVEQYCKGCWEYEQYFYILPIKEDYNFEVLKKKKDKKGRTNQGPKQDEKILYSSNHISRNIYINGGFEPLMNYNRNTEYYFSKSNQPFKLDSLDYSISGLGLQTKISENYFELEIKFKEGFYQISASKARINYYLCYQKDFWGYQYVDRGFITVFKNIFLTENDKNNIKNFLSNAIKK